MDTERERSLLVENRYLRAKSRNLEATCRCLFSTLLLTGAVTITLLVLLLV